MDIENIYQLSKTFREVLDEISKEKLYHRLSVFEYFPRGCCGYASNLLAEYLEDNGVLKQKIQLVNGESFEHQYTHYWLMINEKYFLDITADQFNGKNYFIKYKQIPKVVIVERNTYIYKKFNDIKTNYSNQFGIDTYHDDISNKLRILYNEALKIIESRV